MGITYYIYLKKNVRKDINDKVNEFRKSFYGDGEPVSFKELQIQIHKEVYEEIKADFGYRITSLENENNNLCNKNESLKAENEKISANLQEALYRLNVLEQKVNNTQIRTNYASEQELKRKISDLENSEQELKRKVSNLEDKVKELAELPNYINAAMQKMQSAYEARIKQLEQTVQSLKTAESAQSAKAAPAEEITVHSAETKTEAKSEAKAKEQPWQEVIEDVPEFKPVIEAKEEVLPWEEESHKTEETPKAEPVEIAVQPRIARFNLPQTDAVFLPNDEDSAEKALQNAMDVDDIIAFLQSSKLESKDAFVRIVEKYKKNLGKMIDKFDFDDYDEEEISEAITEKFFKVVQDNLLNTLAISIYRGMNNEDEKEIYAEFAKKVNAYLTKCGIYTRYIKEGRTISDQDYDDMNIIKKTARHKDEDRIITEVERLPYYINYLDEDDEIQQFCYDGSMTVLIYGDK